MPYYIYYNKKFFGDIPFLIQNQAKRNKLSVCSNTYEQFCKEVILSFIYKWTHFSKPPLFDVRVNNQLLPE